MKKILGYLGVIVAIMSASLLMIPLQVEAATDVCLDDDIPDDVKQAAGCQIDKNTTILTVADNIIPFVMGMLSFVGIGVIIYGGFTFLTSAGDGGKVQRGRRILISGVVGLIVAWGAYAIVAFALSIIK